MKWLIYSTIKGILLVAYGLIMGPWAVEAIEPIAITFRVIVALTLIVMWMPIWTLFEDGINIRKKLE